jgi:predicted RNA binding protein YcfA (HicA-like mRNA interferase family)
MKAPVLSARQCVRALSRLGFAVVRQRGSHIILKRREPPGRAVVPNHAELKPGTLRGLLEEAGIGWDDFLAALR